MNGKAAKQCWVAQMEEVTWQWKSGSNSKDCAGFIGKRLGFEGRNTDMAVCSGCALTGATRSWKNLTYVRAAQALDCACIAQLH